MNNAWTEGGEPAVFKLIWGCLYLLLLALLVGFLLFVLVNWKSLPVAILVVAVVPIIAFVAALCVCARCYLGKDAFLFDHPVSCHTSEKGFLIAGLFSKTYLTPNMVRDVHQFGGWIVVKASMGERTRHLWFAPWFRNREQVVKSIRGG